MEMFETSYDERRTKEKLLEKKNGKIVHNSISIPSL